MSTIFSKFPADRDPYMILNIKPNADTAEIRTAYRRAALLTHPDKAGGSAAAFRNVAFAFDLLSCSALRTAYDQARACASCQPPVVQQCSGKAWQQGHPTPRTRKRSATGNLNDATTKRFCRARPEETTSAVSHCTTSSSLEAMRGLLQCMSLDLRRSSLSDLPMSVKNALVSFMEGKDQAARGSETSDSSKCAHAQGRPMAKQQSSTSSKQQTRLRPIRSTHGRSYYAQVDFDLLRIYTRGHRDIDKAIEHQLILCEIRDAFYKEGTGSVFQEPVKMLKIVEGVLRRHLLSPRDIGLRACVQMRATQYLDRRHVVTSPVMPLTDAMRLKVRLSKARQASWACFRTEWIRLMCLTRNARSKRLSHSDAEVIADQARQDFLKMRFVIMTRRAELALKAHEAKVRKQQQRLTKAALSLRAVGKSGCVMRQQRLELFLQRRLSLEEKQRLTKGLNAAQGLN